MEAKKIFFLNEQDAVAKSSIKLGLKLKSTMF